MFHGFCPRQVDLRSRLLTSSSVPLLLVLPQPSPEAQPPREVPVPHPSPASDLRKRPDGIPDASALYPQPRPGTAPECSGTAARLLLSPSFPSHSPAAQPLRPASPVPSPVSLLVQNTRSPVLVAFQEWLSS